MKYRFTIALLIVTILLNAQEENSKNLTGKSKGYNLLLAGIETSTTSYIDTDTRDSNGVHLYLSPYIDYNHKSGIGIRVKSYILAGGSDPGFYLTSISPYFARYSGKFLPYISYTRYLQHDNPSVPYSPIQNELYAHLRFKTRYIEPWAGIDIGFGNDEQNNSKSVSDINAFAALTHLFLKENIGINKNNAFAIRSGVQLNAGTDRYYKFLRTSSYISQNTKASRIGYGRGRRNNNQGGSGGATSPDIYIISEDNNFGLSNIEANLYVIYFFGSFSIEPSGSLYFPLRGDDRNPYGYWQLNINYWIK